MSLLRESYNEILKEYNLIEMNEVEKHFINRQENIDQIVNDLVTSVNDITPSLAKSIARVGLMNKKFILANNIKPEMFINAVGTGVQKALENKEKAVNASNSSADKPEYIPFDDKSLAAKAYYLKTGKLSPREELLKSKAQALHHFKTEDEKKSQIKKNLPPDLNELDPWERLKYIIQKDRLQHESIDEK